MDDIQRAIDYFERKLQQGTSKCRRNHYETAVSAMQELQQYHQIETIEECREAVKRQQECKNCGYKIYSERASKLHDCNDCGRKNNCLIRPGYGKYCRINYYYWIKETGRKI